MNDPHVVVLIYRIQHGDHVDYKNAGSRTISYENFDVEVSGESARISMKSHYATREEARLTVEPVLRAWELDQALEYGPRTIEFIYDRSEIMDRAPIEGHYSLMVEPLHFRVELGSPVLTLDFAAFPVPAQNIARNEVVDHMFERYCLYKQGGTLLADAANFCLTCLAAACGGPKNIPENYHVHEKVVSKIGDLAANKGGREARKGKGVSAAYSDAERQWLEAAMKVLIRRAAEVAFDPQRVPCQICMRDLPSLP
jgi:hypothetical protein